MRLGIADEWVPRRTEMVAANFLLAGRPHASAEQEVGPASRQDGSKFRGHISTIRTHAKTFTSKCLLILRCMIVDDIGEILNRELLL